MFPTYSNTNRLSNVNNSALLSNVRKKALALLSCETTLRNYDGFDSGLPCFLTFIFQDVKAQQKKGKRRLEGKILKLQIECAKHGPQENKDEEMAISSCLLVKTTGKFDGKGCLPLFPLSGKIIYTN